jgi:hypothetical protein
MAFSSNRAETRAHLTAPVKGWGFDLKVGFAAANTQEKR